MYFLLAWQLYILGHVERAAAAAGAAAAWSCLGEAREKLLSVAVFGCAEKYAIVFA